MALQARLRRLGASGDGSRQSVTLRMTVLRAPLAAAASGAACRRLRRQVQRRRRLSQTSCGEGGPWGPSAALA
eukprot:5664599-Pyramimonas_sp.AAC.1